MTKQDEKFMAQAFRLAAKGGRTVAPNPLVGAVIVQKGKIIGQGYHQRFGGPHAEVLAIASVKRKTDLQGATLYVTLEPCRHHGKTPPCQNLIGKAGITTVICGSRDPFQRSWFVVRNKKRPPRTPNNEPRTIFLKGKIAQKCQILNKFFFTWVTKKRPYITIKIATSADDFVAGPNSEQIHFTSKAQDRRTHQLRAQHQAIMVGSGTVLSDDPSLTVRHIKGSNPLRIILDSQKRIPGNAKVFKYKNYLHITQKCPLKTLFRKLARQGIASVLVEPGPTLYASLKKSDLIDELIILKGKKKIYCGLKLDL